MAKNAVDSRIIEYKDTIRQLNTTIASQAETIRALQQTIAVLTEKVDYLTQKLFGKSSEKTKDIAGQLSLFDEAEQEAAVVSEDGREITIKEHKRKAKGTHAELFKGIPARDEVIPLSEEQDWSQFGVGFNRATLANWIIYCSEHYFTALYGYLQRELLKREFLMADETRVQVLKEAGRRAETNSYMWLFRSGEDGLPPIILYRYTETRAKFNAAEFLSSFSGYLETDCYQGYDNLPDVKRCCCWAHYPRSIVIQGELLTPA